MQIDIDKIVEWCKTWSMELSPEKCKFMHLGKQSSLKDYFIAAEKGFRCARIIRWYFARTN